MSEVPTLAACMASVMRDMPAVGKNSQAPGNMGGYSFRGIEDVLAALKPALAAHGVFCVPAVRERVVSERPVGQNKTMFVVDLLVEWTFYGPAGDSITASCWGEGTDMGDKATQKAMTSAFKSMLMQTFAIGDAASDAERHTVPDTERRQADDIDPATGSVRTTATRPTTARPAPTPAAAKLAAPAPTSSPTEALGGDDPFRPFDESNELLAGPMWARKFAVAMTASGHEPKVAEAVVHYATGGTTRAAASVLRSQIKAVAATHAALDAGKLAIERNDSGKAILVEVPAAGAGPGTAA